MYKRLIKPVIIMLSVTAAIILVFMPFNESGNQKGYQAALQGDYETAFSEWSLLAEKGDIEAQFNLGVLYNNGDGVSKDMNRAVKWYQRVAEQGDAPVQFMLGAAYDRGVGVREDDDMAAIYYRRTSMKRS